ncbi:MAG: hypothetical protein ABJL67_18820 [Sulfitobacter sp.]
MTDKEPPRGQLVKDPVSLAKPVEPDIPGKVRFAGLPEKRVLK